MMSWGGPGDLPSCISSTILRGKGVVIFSFPKLLIPRCLGLILRGEYDAREVGAMLYLLYWY